MTRIIAISNRKGGTGKTTTSVNLSAALAHSGARVLLIDADPQGHSTISLGIAANKNRPDLTSLLVEKKQPEEIMIKTYLDNLKIIPAGGRLLNYERNYAHEKKTWTLLAEQLRSLNGNFEYIILDTPPTLSLMMVSSLIASTEVIIPMQTHFLSLEALAEMVSLVSKIKRLYNPQLKIKGIVPTFYKERARLSRSVIEQISKNLGPHIILHPVRVNISLAEAPSFGKTIFQYNMKSNGAYDYLAIAREIEG